MFESGCYLSWFLRSWSRLSPHSRVRRRYSAGEAAGDRAPRNVFFCGVLSALNIRIKKGAGRNSVNLTFGEFYSQRDQQFLQFIAYR